MATKRTAAARTKKTGNAVKVRQATRRGPAGPRGPAPGESAIPLDHPDVAVATASPRQRSSDCGA